MTNRLLLIRHAENPANLTKEFSHRLVDYSLTPKGVLQAQQTADFLRRRSIDAVYASPLKRTRETAQMIADAHGLPITVVEEFREVNVGDLEGRPVSAENWRLHDSVIDGWFTGEPAARFPGGEDYHTLLHRLRTGLTAATAGRDGCTIVVVGHGGLFSAPIKDICTNVDVAWLRRQRNENCSITEIVVQPDPTHGITGTLIRWGDFSHLYGTAADLVSGSPTAADQLV